MFIVFSYSTFGIYVLVQCLPTNTIERIHLFSTMMVPQTPYDPGFLEYKVVALVKKICGLKSQAF